MASLYLSNAMHLSNYKKSYIELHEIGSINELEFENWYREKSGI